MKINFGLLGLAVAQEWINTVFFIFLSFEIPKSIVILIIFQNKLNNDIREDPNFTTKTIGLRI